MTKLKKGTTFHSLIFCDKKISQPLVASEELFGEKLSLQIIRYYNIISKGTILTSRIVLTNQNDFYIINMQQKNK
jgi:hypothetical protein